MKLIKILFILLIYNSINAQVYSYTTNKICIQDTSNFKDCNNTIGNFYLNIDNKTLKISNYDKSYNFKINTYYKIENDKSIYFIFTDNKKKYIISFNNDYKVITLYLEDKTVFFYINIINKLE